MTCRECVELLMDFLDGELDEALAVHFCEHLERCPPCVTYVETYKMTMHLTRKLPCRELPPDVAERLLAALKNPKPE